MTGTVPTRRIKVLCVDDDPYLTDLLQYALSRDGFIVDVAHSGAAALHCVQADRPEVVVLDVGLPDADGLDLCRRFRGLGLPVILLTARNRESDELAGFQQGADDYVAKPFNLQILSCRIRSIARGHQAAGGAVPSRKSYHLGSGMFDAEEHVLIGPGVRVRLTPTQGRILRVLLENEGRVISADQLMTKVWHYDAESDLSVVKTHISNLRAKIALALGGPDLVHTVPGVGYILRQPEQIPPPAPLETAV